MFDKKYVLELEPEVEPEVDEAVEKYVKMIRIGQGSPAVKQTLWYIVRIFGHGRTQCRYKFWCRAEIPGKGIPIGAVENKMKLDNVDPDKLQPYL